MIKTGFAFNTMTKEDNMLNYYFYLDAFYNEIKKKSYFSPDILKALYEFIISRNAKRYALITDDHIGTVSHYKILDYHHIKDMTERHEIKRSCFKENHNYSLMSDIEIFYKHLMENFYKMNPSFQMFSVFKSKSENDQNYYMCLGVAQLSKCLNYSKYKPIKLGYLLSKKKRWTTETMKDKPNFLPIGKYFVFVKFQKNNAYTENFNKFKELHHNSVYPTRINGLKYYLNEDEINKNLEKVEVDFKLF